ALSAWKACATEKPGASLWIRRKVDLHRERPAGRIGRRNNLHNLAGDRLLAERVDHDRHCLTQTNRAHLALVHGGFQAEVARVFDDQQRDARSRNRATSAWKPPWTRADR